MRLLLAGLCALAIAPVAAGYVISGDRWPESTVSRCGIGACKATWRCLLRADDGKGLRELYGKRPPA